MSLIDKFNPEVLAAAQAGMAVQTAQAPAAPSMIAPPAAPAPMISQPPAPPVQTMPAAAGVGVQISMAQAVDAEAQRLAAEEAARRAQAAAGIPPGFAQAVAAIENAKRGSPAYVGRAAQAIAQLRGFRLEPGMSLAGGGWLGERVKNAIEDPALILQLAAEVSGLPPLPEPPPAPVAPPAPMVAGVMPPDAPASNPAIAAQPVEGFDNAKARELAALTTPTIPGLTDTAQQVAATGQLPAPTLMMTAPPVVTGIAATPPGTVVTMTAQPGTYIATPPQAPTMPAAAPAVGTVPPQAAAPAPAAVPPQTTETAAAPTRKRAGRPPSANPRKKKTTTTETVGDVSRTVETEETDDGSINLYVNCIPSFPYERLESYIEQLERALAAQYGASDIRCAPKDGALGYDKWIGGIAAFARHTPPGPGHWVVKNANNRMVDAVIEALRTKVDETGGQLIEGVAW